MKHDASRIVQTCVKYGTALQRDAIMQELKGKKFYCLVVVISTSLLFHQTLLQNNISHSHYIYYLYFTVRTLWTAFARALWKTFSAENFEVRVLHIRLYLVLCVPLKGHWFHLFMRVNILICSLFFFGTKSDLFNNHTKRFLMLGTRASLSVRRLFPNSMAKSRRSASTR